MASLHAQGLPSPATTIDSPAPSTVGSTLGGSTLPAQRHHPLRAGSAKEIALINYVDDKVLLITRRYGTKFADIKTKKNEAPGYTSFDQVIADIDPLIDLVWSTGTPTLQISYLLVFAGFIATYMPAFDFTTKMFRTVRRFDAAFSALLNNASNEIGSRSTVSMTEKVRIRSLVEETRVNAVNTASASGRDTNIDDLSDSDDDNVEMEIDRTNVDEDGDEIDDDKTALALSKIYKSTLEILGDRLTE